MENKENIFYSMGATEFINSFQGITTNNEKVIKQLNERVEKGDYDKILVSYVEESTSNRWIKKIILRYMGCKGEVVEYTFNVKYITEYRMIDE